MWPITGSMAERRRSSRLMAPKTPRFWPEMKTRRGFAVLWPRYPLKPLPPMAQVRALVRERVLEELLVGEELEIGVMDPALAHAFVGQPKDVLEQQQANDEAGLDPGSAVLAVERRDLAVDPFPTDPAGELHQLMHHIDDLVEPRPEQIARTRRLMLLRPHRPLRCDHRIMLRNSRES
jgi:hypothetical protein